MHRWMLRVELGEVSALLSWHYTAPTRTPTPTRTSSRGNSVCRTKDCGRVRRVGVSVRVGVVECQLYATVSRRMR